MKTQFFAFLITLLCVPTATQAQITLDHAFPDKWNVFTTTLSDGSLYYVVEWNTPPGFWSILNDEDYSTHKIILLNAANYCPTGSAGYMERPSYITDKLFDSDEDIEYLTAVRCSDTITGNITLERVMIIDGNNTVLFSRDSALLMNNGAAFSGIQYSGVVNTGFGAKLLLHVNNGSEIWSLPGSLPVQLEVVSADMPDMATYPNPVQKSCTVTYNTHGVTNGRLAIRDINGVEVDSQPFYGESGSLQVDVSGLAAGMYTVSLISGENVLGSKKIVVAQ